MWCEGELNDIFGDGERVREREDEREERLTGPSWFIASVNASEGGVVIVSHDFRTYTFSVVYYFSLT